MKHSCTTLQNHIVHFKLTRKGSVQSQIADNDRELVPLSPLLLLLLTLLGLLLLLLFTIGHIFSLILTGRCMPRYLKHRRWGLGSI